MKTIKNCWQIRPQLNIVRPFMDIHKNITYKGLLENKNNTFYSNLSTKEKYFLNIK